VGHDEGVPEHRMETLTEDALPPQLTSEAARQAGRGQAKGSTRKEAGREVRTGGTRRANMPGRTGVRQRYSGRMASGESLVRLPQGTVMGAMPGGHGWIHCPKRPGQKVPVFLQEAEGGRKKGHANPTEAEDD